MARTSRSSRDGRRHMEELGDLFSDVPEVSFVLIQDLLKHHKNDRYLKQSIRRLSERGLIEKHPTKYVVTEEGKRFFDRYYPSTESAPKGRWDGKWRIVSFDVPGGYRLERNMIRSLLKSSRFYRLHKSVWASPSHLSQDFWKTLVHLGLHEYCKVMLVEILEGDEELRDYFHP